MRFAHIMYIVKQIEKWLMYSVRRPLDGMNNSRALMRLPSIISSQREKKKSQWHLGMNLICNYDLMELTPSRTEHGFVLLYHVQWKHEGVSLRPQSCCFFIIFFYSELHPHIPHVGATQSSLMLEYETKTLTKVKSKEESCSFWLYFGHLEVVCWVWLCLVNVRAYLQTWRHKRKAIKELRGTVV